MDDIWLHVFAHLNIQDLHSCEAVSRQWRVLAEKSLRRIKSIDIEKDCEGCVEESSKMCKIFAKCGNSLSSVRVGVTSSNKRYENFTSGKHLTKAVMQMLCGRAKRLKKLHLERVILTFGAIECLSELPECLEELCIRYCNMYCVSVQENEVLQKALALLLAKCTKLDRFELICNGYSFDHFKLDNALLSHLPSSIHYLTLSPGNSLNINSIDFINGMRLRSLNLRDSFISSASLTALISMKDTLEELDLSNSSNLFDFTPIGQLSNLKMLMLGGYHEGIEDQSLFSIIQGCKQLRKLSLDKRTQFTQKALAALDGLPQLEWLSLSSCSNVDDIVVDRLCNCQNLEYLELNMCRKVTSLGLLSLLQSLPNLKHLEVLGIRSYSHSLLSQCRKFPSSIVSDAPMESISIILPPIPTQSNAGQEIMPKSAMPA
ncbi:hypothetical protein WR25_01652 [Diploscapter pachys]|uniref:F-box domain-containing protein n=1 Tax=Diploscapter pachys TaxID=2018661 RepID=A0A2A2JSA8_9BILA|nr:hypothetical protein WR25_01652 [Diploscapter pachys]